MGSSSFSQSAVLLANSFHRPVAADVVSETEKLAATIERAIRRETDGSVRNLGVKVLRSSILLTGCCATYYVKQIAQHAAMTACDNLQIVNRIEVL